MEDDDKQPKRHEDSRKLPETPPRLEYIPETRVPSERARDIEKAERDSDANADRSTFPDFLDTSDPPPRNDSSE